MNNQFFEKPILNALYGYPSRHSDANNDANPELMRFALKLAIVDRGGVSLRL